MLIAGRFLLEQKVGVGGMGTVYRALDRQSGAPVAIKVATNHDDAGRARALAEADALTLLDHPAIVRFVANGLAPDGRAYLAMEWLDGEDLAARLTRGPLTVAEAEALGARAAAALAAAHARGVVHRDIKPSNLFLPGGDVAQVKLVDFGIARFANALERLTVSGMLVGTPSYMAPEQATAQSDVGAPADLFALGAVLFECLAGHPAFRGDNVMALLTRVLLDEPPRLDSLRADVPHALAALVARLLAKAPAERPTAAEVTAALTAPERAAAGAPVGEAITREEQRLVCVLLAREAPELSAPASGSGVENTVLATTAAAGFTMASVRPERETLDRLRAVVAPLGGRADRLLNGALVASWLVAGPPTAATRDPAGLRPETPRDQAARAARAALQARQRLPGATIALASGLTERRGALPLGPVLDRAAALLDTGEPPADVVLVDDVTAGLLDARFELAPSPAGLELLAERALDQEEARPLLGRSVPCVGRRRELRALDDLLDECVTEPVARAVLVTARPGTGKSRLRRELLRRSRLRDDVDVWMAGADEFGAGSPFALLGAALHHAVGVRVGDPLEQRRAHIEQRAARHVPEAERARVAAFLGELAAAPFPVEAHPLLAAARRNPAMMAEQIRRAWLDLLAAEVAARPVLLVLEDLHWGDKPSLTLIDAALGALQSRPFMVLAFARPEVRDRFPDLWVRYDVQDLRLGDLSSRAAGQLVHHALPEATDTLVQRLVERAGGNAFYLEELIRAVAAGRGDVLPESVAAMVQARLDALAPDERHMLRAASVFGEVFWERGVFALLDVAEHAPAAAQLDGLVDREILVRRANSRFPGEQELAFRHAFLSDGAYATLTEADRARGHRLAARWLESVGEDDPLILATHHERGAEPARAAACYHRAAERALAGSDSQGALVHAERALAVGPGDALRPRVLHVLMLASWHSGRLDEAERWAAEVLAGAPRGSGLWCSVAHVRLIVFLQRADANAVLFGVAAAEGVEATLENAGPLLRLVSGISLALNQVAPLAVAEPYRARAEAIVEVFGESIEPGSLGYFYFSGCSWQLFVEANLEQAVRKAEEALRCFDAAGDRLHEGLTRIALGIALRDLGAFERAEAELRRTVKDAAPGAHNALIGRAILATLLADRGALEEAAREAAEATAEAQVVADRFAEATGRIARIYVLLRKGAAAEAEREARAALEGEFALLLTQGRVQVLLAEARLAQGAVSEALSLVRELRGAGAQNFKVTRMLMRPVEAEALIAAGEQQEARAVLAEGRAEILAMAARIEDAALRESFLTRGPMSAALLRLAEANGVGAEPRPPEHG